eukprot:515916-Pleurochrysis_carterae.AAC.1
MSCLLSRGSRRRPGEVGAKRLELAGNAGVCAKRLELGGKGLELAQNGRVIAREEQGQRVCTRSPSAPVCAMHAQNGERARAHARVCLNACESANSTRLRMWTRA